MNWKISAVIFLLFTILLPAVPADNLKVSEKTALLGKVWGLLKYYHPNVTKESSEWDNAFLDFYNLVKRAENSDAVNVAVEQMINRAGGVNVLDQRNDRAEGSVNDRSDVFGWIDDSSVLNSLNKLKLKLLVVDTLSFTNRYISKGADGRADFSKEKDYEDLGYFPEEKYRALAVVRYWNLVNYFYPGKSVIVNSWDDAMITCLEEVVKVPGQDEYHMAMKAFTAAVRDAQSQFVSDVFKNVTGIYGVPFKVKCIDNKILVTTILNGRLSGDIDIKMGDEIVAVDGVPVTDLKNVLSKQVSYSNQRNLDRNVCEILLNGRTESVTITIKRDENVDYELRRYSLLKLNEEYEALRDTTIWRNLDSSTAYINLSYLKSEDTEKCIEEVKKSQNVILDCRYGADHAVAMKIVELMNSSSTAYVKYTEPDLTSPGRFIFQEPFSAGPSEANSKSYNGKVYVLVDRNVQGATELSVMALQAMSNTKVVGESTAGSADTTSTVTLPGRIVAGFSTRGLFYPDGTGIRQGGIRVDETVAISTEGVTLGKDEILDKTLSLIQSGSQGN